MVEERERVVGKPTPLKKFSTEAEGQQDFYNKFKNYIEEFKDLSVDEIMEKVCILSTDGTWDCNILEFKLNLTDINKTLLQTIKYLSRFRIVGHEIPRNIILIDLNKGLAYLFDSKDYLQDIEKVYLGGASSDNEGHLSNRDLLERIYYNSIEGSERMVQVLRGENLTDGERWTKINIDESCIVGWAERFYRENPNADKASFLGSRNQLYSATDGEIYQPNYFKNYITNLEQDARTSIETTASPFQLSTINSIGSCGLITNKTSQIIRVDIHQRGWGERIYSEYLGVNETKEFFVDIDTWNAQQSNGDYGYAILCYNTAPQEAGGYIEVSKPEYEFELRNFTSHLEDGAWRIHKPVYDSTYGIKLKVDLSVENHNIHFQNHSAI